MKPHRLLLLTPFLAVVGVGAARAADEEVNAGARNGVFVQLGKAGSTGMAVVGLTRDWGWHRPWGRGLVTGFWELSVGRWTAERRSDDDGGSASAWVTQIGATPVLRWYPDGCTACWFVEGGIGANLLTPIYRSTNKRFSTAFNFGDHLALGWRFGDDGRRELALRLQHFSNAGIKHPNPGENFLQLRYTVKF